MHAELPQEHGGLDGPVDENALGAALARPKQLEHYSNPTATLSQLAAAYGFGFAENHCFRDGDKRVALVAVDVFLQMNGYELVASEVEAAVTFQALAAGEFDESQLAEWIVRNMQVVGEG
ncbi:MAG: type II toxin-antitoxin system death-on-curing family toxin [Candidatus Thiodiazotropha sp. (ex Dulcina madagascariensis)]|nr:type II toxin-antitoxin system death-on-curing family toxin [Candidatus Thiodiazotropha sp. (ex Dulcina madagascariensis)]MCU7926626.1 type II toxin-antitoxin system death-on-curing family toxin [Candidatus Thiodiazotropha sp. (ex Dulcina madagascariensis)]